MKKSWVVAASALTMLGCGSDNEPNPPSGAAERPTVTAAATTRATEPKIVDPGGENGTLGAVRARLEAAGYEVEQEDVSGAAVAGLRIGTVSVTGYRDSADAEAEADAIRRVFAEQPGRGLVRVEGTRVYYLAQERALTEADRAKLARVVRTGEGG